MFPAPLLFRDPHSAFLPSLPRKHRMDGFENDHGIKLQGIMPDIIQIVGQLLHRIPFAFAIGIIYLCPSRNARLHQVPEMIERNLLPVTLRAFHPFRPRPDQAQLAVKHVPQLR